MITSKGLLRFIEKVLAAPCAVEFVMCLYSLIMFPGQFWWGCYLQFICFLTQNNCRRFALCIMPWCVQHQLELL